MLFILIVNMESKDILLLTMLGTLNFCEVYRQTYKFNNSSIRFSIYNS